MYLDCSIYVVNQPALGKCRLGAEEVNEQVGKGKQMDGTEK